MIAEQKTAGHRAVLMRRWAVAMVFVAAGPTGWGAARAAEPDTSKSASSKSASSAPTLEAFMRRFKGLEGFEARFVETKTMAMLAVPLVTEGRLFLPRPTGFFESSTNRNPAGYW